MKLTGGCYCKDVRYQIEGKAQAALHCHCRECQYISGDNPNALMIFPLDAFELTQGEMKSFRRSDLDSPVTRYFCKTCGTSLATQTPKRPGSIVIKVGTLDDPSVFTPGPRYSAATSRLFITFLTASPLLTNGRANSLSDLPGL